MTAFQAKNGSKWIRRLKRLRIYARDGWKCVWCGCDVYSPGKSPHGPAFNPAGYPKAQFRSETDPLRMATLDHVLPREHGGGNEAGNLITACLTCNEERGTLSPLQFAYTMQRREAKQRVTGFLTDGGEVDPQGTRALIESAAFYLVAEVLDRVIRAITSPLPPKETPC